MNTHKGITYRVNVAYDTRKVTITSFGINRVDNEVDGDNPHPEAKQGSLALVALKRQSMHPHFRFSPDAP